MRLGGDQDFLRVDRLIGRLELVRSGLAFFRFGFYNCIMLRSSSGTLISPAYTICQGAVPDRGRGLGYMAPTLHFVGTRRDHYVPTAPRQMPKFSTHIADAVASVWPARGTHE